MKRRSMTNDSFTVAKISVVVTVIAIAGIFFPTIAGIDGFGGGYALSLISLMIALSALVTSLVFWWTGNKQEHILNGDEVLAHWRYTENEWKIYIEEEHRRDAADKKGIYCVIVFFAVLFGILFPILDHTDGWFVTWVCLVLIIFMGAVAWFSIWHEYQRNRKKLGEVYIAKSGVVFNGRMHAWTLVGSRFGDVRLVEHAKVKYLDFTYSAWARYGRQYFTVRIPVPRGKVAEAKNLVRLFS